MSEFSPYELAIISRMKGELDCAPSSDVLLRAVSLSRCLPKIESSGAAQWWNAARTVLASVVTDRPVLAGAGLRGGIIRTMEFSQRDVHIDLEVEPLRTHTRNSGVVRGQVEAMDKVEGVPVVFVDSQGSARAATTLDDLGFFSTTLPSGTYQLAIALPAGAVVAAGIHVQ